ncbi:hypothetical protein J2X97_000390 [Epilithonimonas hungarica]|nr:hypothetical protein [Epilithonimonas hungarica]
MKTESAYIEAIQKLRLVNRNMFETKLINRTEYKANSQILFQSILTFIVFTEKQKILIKLSGNNRLCVTKFRLCLMIINTNLN